MFFDCYCRSLTSGSEKLLSTQIWDFSNISLFPKSQVVRQLMRQLVYQVCFISYHVPFYLWLIVYVLKHCEVPKYYGQNCSSFKKEKKRACYILMPFPYSYCLRWNFKKHNMILLLDVKHMFLKCFYDIIRLKYFYDILNTVVILAPRCKFLFVKCA